jgi:hypothetical protein
VRTTPHTVTAPTQQGSTKGLLSAQIAASGLSVSEFARTVCGRDPRTVRRWLAGETIPYSVSDWLERAHVESNGRSVVIRVARVHRDPRRTMEARIRAEELESLPIGDA